MEIVESILSKMSSVSRHQKKFLLILFSTIMALRGKVNFRNLSRYSDLSEISYLRNFRKTFEFNRFNHMLIMRTIPVSNIRIAAIDCSFIPKSGKETWGISHFFSSCAGRALKGLEVSTLSIVDVDYNSAYTLSVEQTPPSSEIGNGEENRVDFYLAQIERNRIFLKEQLVRHIAADGFYAKKRFIDGNINMGFHLVGKLRKDANLRYFYNDVQKPGRGAPRLYDGKVKFDDLSRWELAGETEKGISLYTLELNSPRFKRNLKVVCLMDRRKPDKKRRVLLFSTDLSLSAMEIYLFYKSRFQIEFIFRDAKQFTGLCDCQARKKEALDFHFNASLTTLNLLRKQDRESSSGNRQKSNVCSIASWKARYFNERLLNLFISHLELEPVFIKNNRRYEELINYGAIAA